MAEAADPAEVARRRSQMIRAITAASIGNALEYYDLTLYLYFAGPISRLFFPTDDPRLSLLIALGSFGASYLMRPLGAIVLGLYADRAGRKPALMLSIALMTVGTAMMALMPPYASIGVMASVGVLLARLLQGFSAGGEFGSSTAFMVEHGPGRHGFFASFQFASQGLNMLTASLFALILSASLSEADVAAWGWRLLYLFGLLIGPVGLYIRRHVDETPDFAASEEAPAAAAAPLRDLFARQWVNLLLATGLVATSTSLNYMIGYMPTFAVRQLGLPGWIGYVASFGGSAMLVLAPLVGHLSDRIGRTPIMGRVALAVIVVMWPLFALVTGFPSLFAIVPAVVVIGALKSSYSAALPALLAEIFPVRTRSTGMNLGYNLGVTLFGGFAPFWSESLIALTHSTRAPAFYLMACAALSLVCLRLVRRRLGLR